MRVISLKRLMNSGAKTLRMVHTNTNGIEREKKTHTQNTALCVLDDTTKGNRKGTTTVFFFQRDSYEFQDKTVRFIRIKYRLRRAQTHSRAPCMCFIYTNTFIQAKREKKEEEIK